MQGADALLPDVQADFLLADRAYDAQERVIEKLQAKNCEAVIPSKSNRIEKRDHDRHLYKARHLIENLFAKLKKYGSTVIPVVDTTDSVIVKSLTILG